MRARHLLALIPLLLLTGCESAELAAVQAASDANTADIEALQTTVTTQAATIETLQTTATEQQDTIDTLATTVAELQTRLAAVEGYGDHGAVGYLDAASVAGGLSQADVDAWNETRAEVEGTSDGIADSRIDLLQDDLDVVEADVTGLGSDVTSLQTQATTIQADLDLAELDLAAVEGNVTTLQVDLGDAVDAIDTLETSTLGLISTDTTLVVADPPGTDEFATVHEALDWLDGYAIERDVTVQIAIDGGTYTYDEPIFVQHRDGARVQIVGDPLSSTTLEFPLSDGIVVGGGSALGLLADLALEGSADVFNGLTVTENSWATVADLEIETWGGNGVYVTRGSALDLEDGAALTLTGCDDAVEVTRNGYAGLDGAAPVIWRDSSPPSMMTSGFRTEAMD